MTASKDECPDLRPLVAALDRNAAVSQVVRVAPGHVRFTLHSGAAVYLTRIEETVGQGARSAVWEAELRLRGEESLADAVSRSDDASIDSAISLCEALVRLDTAHAIAEAGARELGL